MLQLLCYTLKRLISPPSVGEEDVLPSIIWFPLLHACKLGLEEELQEEALHLNILGSPYAAECEWLWALETHKLKQKTNKRKTKTIKIWNSPQIFRKPTLNWNCGSRLKFFLAVLNLCFSSVLENSCSGNVALWRTLQKTQFCFAPDYGPPSQELLHCLSVSLCKAVVSSSRLFTFGTAVRGAAVLWWPRGGTASWETEAKQNFLFQCNGLHYCWFLCFHFTWWFRSSSPYLIFFCCLVLFCNMI